MTLLALCFAAFFAGFIDAISGGGGLIQLPVLLIFLPEYTTLPSAATAFGTNKFSSVWGTLTAAIRFTRKVRIPWSSVVPAAVAAAATSYLGATAVSTIPLHQVRYIILALLIAVAAHTFLNKNWGEKSNTPIAPKLGAFIALCIGITIGFYDGFFGPGTGSFLIFAFIAFLNLNFLQASASAKIVNLVTNLFALIFFIAHGNVFYRLAIPMAACNVAGAWVGSHLAIARGNKFVRMFFLIAIIMVILKFAQDIVSQ